MTDRAELLRRAGAGAAGLTLGQLLGPGAALADSGGGGGGDFPSHPRWRFVFVSHDTLDPLLVPTQFGAQDAASLVHCTMEWTGSASGSVKETVSALAGAISGKADGIAVTVVDEVAFDEQAEAAARAGIPLVAFNVDLALGKRRFAYVGENPYVSGSSVGAEIVGLVPGGEVLLFAPETVQPLIEQRLARVHASIAAAPKRPRVTEVRLPSYVGKQLSQVESAYRAHTGVRGLFAVDGEGTLAVGHAIKSLGLRAKGVHGGGWDLLPRDLSLVADDTLDFAVDQQAYLQGFEPVLQLFLAKISEGTVIPWDTDTSVILRKADVGKLLATKSRFEGSSSRQEYPLQHA